MVKFKRALARTILVYAFGILVALFNAAFDLRIESIRVLGDVELAFILFCIIVCWPVVEAVWWAIDTLLNSDNNPDEGLDNTPHKDRR